MTGIKVKRLSIGSGSRTAFYDESTRQPLYAEQLGPKAFKVTLTDGNYDHSGGPLQEGQFVMETVSAKFYGYVQEQRPGLGLPETIILTLIAE